MQNRSTPKTKIEVLHYRVEGMGRKGMIRFVRISGYEGVWTITGLNGLRVQVGGKTVEEAVRLAKRKIPFRTIAIRKIEDTPEDQV